MQHLKNNEVVIKDISILSDNWYILKKVTFDFKKNDGTWETISREAYDRGNGAAILLYNVAQKTVVLTRQFRMPTYINGNDTGMMIEVCAGLLDKDNAEDCIRRETEEETGYQISDVKKVYASYMSPGSVTEILHLFIAEYDRGMKIGEGGGLEEDHEDIQVLEMPYEQALQLVDEGIINDGKTIMLLQHLRLKGIL